MRIRVAKSVWFCLLAGCSSTAEPAPFPEWETGRTAESEPYHRAMLATAARPRSVDRVEQAYFAFDAGPYWSLDIDELDTGVYYEVSSGFYLTRYFSLQGVLGYLESDGSSGGQSVDLWGLPFFINGRFDYPVWVFETYAGVGAGLYYYDLKARGTVREDDDGFVAGGAGFLGATLDLGEAVFVGLEGKYNFTGETDFEDARLDGVVLLLSLGFRL